MKKLLIALTLITSWTFANTGDTSHIITHNKVTVITNPGTGTNGYKAWGVFPSSATPVRKAYVTLSYKCPSGMACGAWDYIDQVVVRRMGGVNGTSSNTEIVRFITPYGGQFSTNWSFGWHMDVTDYAALLKDSVEIEYIHTGYEGTNVGWAVTVDFKIIEGTPIANQLSFQPLWNGSFQYGAAIPIDTNLQAISFTTANNCNFTKLRILHTGHGSDNNGCSEFCNKYRTVKFDGAVVNTRNRWKTCGNNALYPQAGTWIYDRSNWCPGSIISPDIIMNSVTGNTSHSYDIDMEPYVGSGSLGNEDINAHLFQYAAPNKTNDAEILELIKPSKLPEYSRFNPVCNNPQLLIRNNGSANITTADIKYGFKNSTLQTYTWNGNIAFGDTASVYLPSLSWTTASNGNFISYINSVNGVADQYAFDDTAKTSIVLPPVYDSAFVIFFYTNNNPSENLYTLTDVNGTVIKTRNGSLCTASTMYRDTVHLIPGCYTIKLYDSGGDGLVFWNNTAQGQGQFKLKKIGVPATQFFNYFNSDFGNFTYLDFIVNPHSTTSTAAIEKQQPYFIVYPNPASDKINVMFDEQLNDAGTLSVVNVLGETIFEQNIKGLSENTVSIDMQKFDNGVYFVRLVKNNMTFTKKVILNR